MEDNQIPSNKKFISIQEEKLIRKVDYESIARASVHSPKKQLLLDLEILQKSSSPLKPSQRVVVSIKQRGLVPIRTIYIAEKNRFHPKRGSEKSGTRLAIGDHSSFTTYITQNTTSSSASPDLDETKQQQPEGLINNKNLLETEFIVSKLSEVERPLCNNHVSDATLGPYGKCYVFKAQPQAPIMSNNKFIKESENLFALTKDVATFTHQSSHNLTRTAVTIINNLISKIDHLERRLRRQEMVLHSIDPHINVSSSDEESKDITMRSTSASGRPGCSYIEQYSHIPETSAFQRLSPSKATTIEKEHNSEQYGRDFTTYDGITARGRRQTASVPYKRDDAPKMAAERVHKIRHKLNPVRDYRLMDTVHYLAQGEFAPRDDGIKLTPSREAVLSDIIWEDVCRTHWPSARLGRRVTHPERVSTRGELQRLIDSLLRERVAHVERRRRRHYRIVKLNHRHESCRPVGKTGDIIVASHKNKLPANEKEMGGSEHNTGSAVMSSRKWQEHSPQRSHRSHGRLISPEPSHKRHNRQDECLPGPSYAVPRAGNNREPTCCYRASNPSRPEKMQKPTRSDCKQKLASSGSVSSGKPQGRTPRLVVKKEVSHKKCSKEEPNLEHFILLPTLVIRTPSNVKRQKKFNELYHRILNVRISNGGEPVDNEATEHKPVLNQKEVGLNINLTLPNNGTNKMENNALPSAICLTSSSVMESVKKWLSERSAKKNGFYVHYSPPRLLGVVSAAQLRQLARGGVDGSLERAVLAGQGRRLLAEADPLPLPSHLASLVAKCEALHEAVEKGSLLELQGLLEGEYNRRKYVQCRDEAGAGLLHKAVYYDYTDIAEWLVENYPQLVHQKDSFGRTPLHYTAAARHAAAASALLERAGAARGARDAAGRTPAFYRDHRTSLALPAATAAAMPPNGPPVLVIKRHNIRIWCHDCDMARLQRVVWEGHGARLLSEVSNQPVVKKFLEAVPYMMNTIKDIHEAVVQNDLEGLMKHSGDPVTPQALSSRDVNNMTVMHKAAGLGHVSIMKYIADRYPQGINDVDNDGRTPLHYAATVRDEQHTYNTLVGLGADEAAVDNKNKTPGYYINRPQEIDKNLLKTIPDAPRTPSSAYPSSWDWKLLDTEVIAELNKKSRRKMKASTENLSSKNNTTTISESVENRLGAMKQSSTHEFIKKLPELDDNAKANQNDDKTGNIIEDSQVIEEPQDANEDHGIDAHEEAGETNEDETQENEGEHSEEHDKQTEETPDVESHGTDDVHKQKDDDEEGKTDDINENKDNDENQTELEDEKPEDDNETGKVDNHADRNDTEDHSSEQKHNVEEHNNKKDDAEHPSDAKEELNIAVDEISNGDAERHEPEDLNVNETNETENDETSQEHENTHHEEESSDLAKDNKNNSHHEVHNNGTQNKSEAEEPKDDEYNEEQNENDENLTDADTKVEEESIATTKEGNNNNDHSEDDDDVQVQGDCNSEYSDTNLRSTAELSDTKSAKRGNQTDGRSTQDSLIEGIISGEAELDSQDASISQREESVHGNELAVDSEIDPEVTELINSTNMEMLAALVLNGEGSRLIGRRSRNAELQAFLDNVSTYMQKINKVHLAAKDGNIKDLQAALDRRKFAIARDSISPNGATPLHVATVFGKTNIMKYLGGRFPETLSAVDFEGRTALHYAAVLPDNGHYYNLIQQLGANAKDLDDNGRSAEDYQKNPSLLPFSQLMADFGISKEAAKEMLSDKGTDYVANGHMDIPIFRTDEGRYLAKSLGDPLIKGLTEVANVKPKDPVAFLASFLHNFPENEKPRIGTQESNVLVTQEAPEVENEQPPPEPKALLVDAPAPALSRSATRTATRPHRPFDVITVDPRSEASPDAPEAAFSSADRDEHGQSMLHFAAARTHTRNALFQLLQESDVNLAFRDELYRTARDVSLQANIPENTTEIDRWVMHLAARGNKEKIMELFLEGYDHILDVVDDEGVPITEVVANRGDTEMSNLLDSIPAFEESREGLHGAIRRGNLEAVEATLSAEGGRTLARGKSSFGRTALHVAVLAQHEEIVAFLASKFPELLRYGDNLERSPLHYAMGVEKIESLSRVLIRAGAKRVLKDLKGRQPSYYFMNKSDILRLKEEEEIY